MRRGVGRRKGDGEIGRRLPDDTSEVRRLSRREDCCGESQSRHDTGKRPGVGSRSPTTPLTARWLRLRLKQYYIVAGQGNYLLLLINVAPRVFMLPPVVFQHERDIGLNGEIRGASKIIAGTGASWLVIHHSRFDGDVRRGLRPSERPDGGVGVGEAHPHTPAHHNHCGEPLEQYASRSSATAPARARENGATAARSSRARPEPPG